MNFELKFNDFDENIIERQGKLGGIQYIFRFKNGYGASVIKSNYSYGSEDDLWEVAVLEFMSEDEDDDDYNLTYDTDITNDVLGFLDDDEVLEVLRDINELE